ncbi:MAG: 50S ribosomal protein L21 [Oscillospiraceae bacterium]|nr:50S ribosomal protein L21 [Oscillospiraceae bacterium]
MYAVVKTGGKQYRVSEGEFFYAEKLEAEVDSKIDLTEVLAIGNDGEITVGDPNIKGASVSCKVLSQGRAKKIIVMKYKPKKHYRKKTGHRQSYTKLLVEKILPSAL